MTDPIGAYRTMDGWAAYAKDGTWKRVTEAEADLIRARTSPKA
jgi:hypothetical protein